jgi:hypothetical protein
MIAHTLVAINNSLEQSKTLIMILRRDTQNVHVFVRTIMRKSIKIIAEVVSFHEISVSLQLLKV